MMQFHTPDKYLALGKSYYFILNGFTAWGTLEYIDGYIACIKDTRFYIASPNGKGMITQKAEFRTLTLSSVVSMVECLEEPKIVEVDDKEDKPSDSHTDQEHG